jgi:hypothetical protein
MSSRGDKWSFPDGSVGHDDSVKGYEVHCSDGTVGTVSWAQYSPGESYLVVTCDRRLKKDTHHLVPAGAIADVDHDACTVTLDVTADEVRSSPEHKGPEHPVDWSVVDQFERGSLGGGAVWPYTDV